MSSAVTGQSVSFLYVQIIPLKQLRAIKLGHLMHLGGNLCLSNVFNVGMAISNWFTGYSVGTIVTSYQISNQLVESIRSCNILMQI